MQSIDAHSWRVPEFPCPTEELLARASVFLSRGPECDSLTDTTSLLRERHINRSECAWALAIYRASANLELLRLEDM